MKLFIKNIVTRIMKKTIFLFDDDDVEENPKLHEIA